uniref:Uncharacterized protein n=1 Tax=Oryza sativa subsp. japonica TaxID=39947 RepID=Q6K286_ORYSJ|nr:hypothetical protein [Oryza sativa Japonica Group]BAD20085.1 hypothetical protein [Oryza sativa Japonica Group]
MWEVAELDYRTCQLDLDVSDGCIYSSHGHITSWTGAQQQSHWVSRCLSKLDFGNTKRGRKQAMNVDGL